MPGIKVVYPAFPGDARGLLVSAVRDPNPVVYFENKYLYRRVKELLPDTIDPVPLGKARICREGHDAAVITYGAMVHEAIRAADALRVAEGYEIMVVDMRSLKPYDKEALVAAVAAASRVLVVHEAWQTCGFGAELVSTIAAEAFHLLDAPVRRLAAPDIPVPFAGSLENAYRPGFEKIQQALVELIEY